MNEHNYKHRHLALNVLSKALDDICPKFELESEEMRSMLIKERAEFFKEQEKLLDKEWNYLERESQRETLALKKERSRVNSKIKKSRNTARIKAKISVLKRSKAKRIAYLKEKLKSETKLIQQQLKTLDGTRKKYTQIQNKLAKFTQTIEHKIEVTTKRFDKLILQTQKLDNAEAVERKLKQSQDIWKRKYDKIKKKYEEQENFYNNRREDLDLVRLAVEGFEHEENDIKHWCEWAGVSVKICYKEVQARLKLLGRKSLKIDELISKM